MTGKKVTFLFGGPGDEHEVSCLTAKSALPAFEDRFVLKPVFITKAGRWVVADNFVPAPRAWTSAEALQTKLGVPMEMALNELDEDIPDIVFIGLHGRLGEDGTLQTFLDAQGLIYTGSDAEASALAIDKPRVLELLQNEGIDVPEFLEVSSATPSSAAEDFALFHQLPLVILPADSGSSVGVRIIRESGHLAEAIKEARKYSRRVLITKYIPGREVSGGVLATGEAEIVALPPTMLIPSSKHQFYDYEAKYTPGETKEVTPPEMDQEIVGEIRNLARRVHLLVGADGYSRTDMIVAPDGKIFVLEINTLPGLTATSIIPQQAKAYGLTFGQFLTTICDNVDRSGQDFLTDT